MRGSYLPDEEVALTKNKNDDLKTSKNIKRLLLENFRQQIQLLKIFALFLALFLSQFPHFPGKEK